jgi:NAD(P)-dependent dehydrogenase (short-subunit alcohol dehydrogenase family)
LISWQGVFGPPIPSHELDTVEFDRINNTNYRGTWLCARAEITAMLTQQPLETHDGRPGNKGAIVNIASNLGIISMAGTGGRILSH